MVFFEFIFIMFKNGMSSNIWRGKILILNTFMEFGMNLKSYKLLEQVHEAKTDICGNRREPFIVFNRPFVNDYFFDQSSNNEMTGIYYLILKECHSWEFQRIVKKFTVSPKKVTT